MRSTTKDDAPVQDDHAQRLHLATEVVIRQSLAAHHIPDHLHDGLVHYLVDHRPPGSFLAGVLSNDLLLACKRGDEQSREALVRLTLWLYEEAPIQSWGSQARYRVWTQGVVK